MLAAPTLQRGRGRDFSAQEREEKGNGHLLQRGDGHLMLNERDWNPGSARGEWSRRNTVLGTESEILEEVKTQVSLKVSVAYHLWEVKD